ncbi:hypothetical protein QL919_08015 [Psychrobacter sp. APC 3426]|uniref:hypothetical protein n=1 Tax=Psychrobacter sp. APC 3426 TaxID=3035177 RepID=UPI0025B4A67E|nr:hypothetical protein [Psychrobacter sp. APC 3426]MDN3398669.1 hypothetical protein [Psychrobacter sp. APC 3426]
MHKAQHFLDSVSSRNSGNYTYQLLSLMGFMVLLLVSSSVFALEDNPGATCPANSFQGSLTSSDYSNLVSATNSNNYIAVSGNIPLEIRTTLQESSTNTVQSAYEPFTNSGKTAINIRRTFPNTSASTDITLNFRNSLTKEPLYLTNVALSAFDIDYANRRGNRFYDYVKFSGITEDGREILSRQQSIPGSFITNFEQRGLFTGGSTGRSNNCSAQNLDTRCQGSIQFPEPVSSVMISYTNTGTLINSSPTNQEVDISLDNYCYAPPSQSYEISKTDNVTSISTNNTTTYTIKVTNTGGNALQNIILKDPVVSGLSKQSNITCDTSDTANVCSTPPTVTQLERSTGFTIPTLAAGKSYSIKVPTLVTAASGTDVTNTATISHTTLADKSSSDTNSVTSIFDGGSFNTPATCPSGHKMYYIGANPPSFSPINSQLLNWTSGNTSRTFTFEESAGNKTFLISFSGIRNLNSNNGTPPYFGSINGVTTSAINMQHVSAAVETNHILDISINRTISKSGYKIQDLDSTIASGQIPYIEQVDVSNSGGQLTFNDVFHTINSGRNIVTAIREKNCGVGECTIDATWGYNTANTPFSLKHNNSFTERRRSPHTVGYSDFYFCLAPPQIIVNKLLDGSRVDGDDQFRIELRRTDNNAFVQAFTTTGSGDVVTDNTTTVTTLTEGVNYTVSEGIINGNLLDYQTTYTCSNATTGTNEVFSSGEMPVNAAGTRRTFAINNVSYGDEITCNVTNTPSQYTFSGIVFNDNGGISSEDKFDTSSTFTGNSSYFNGQFDSSVESGLSHPDLKVSLNDCNGTIIDATNSPNPQSIPISGQYNFIVQADKLPDNNTVCITEIEPDPWSDYPVDTTPNEYEFTLKSGLFNYKTGVQDNTGNTLNLDFGEVIRNQSALVLTKSQYVHQCDDTLDLTNPAINQPTSDPMVGFSDQPPSTNVDPGQCIAYKITATNRGNIDLNDIVVSDTLQKDGVGGATVTSTLADAVSTADGFATDRAIGYNGTISTQPFNLNGKAVRSFYFNTQYGK